MVQDSADSLRPILKTKVFTFSIPFKEVFFLKFKKIVFSTKSIKIQLFMSFFFSFPTTPYLIIGMV